MLWSSGEQSPVGCPHTMHGPKSSATNSTPGIEEALDLPTIHRPYTMNVECDGTRKERAEPSRTTLSRRPPGWDGDAVGAMS